ncbi:hypothetical protein ACWCPI_08345 [Streptomyces sp. NPDC001920]
MRLALVNGAVGVVNAPEGRPLSVMGVTVVGGRITAMYILADTERPAALDLPALDGPAGREISSVSRRPRADIRLMA